VLGAVGGPVGSLVGGIVGGVVGGVVGGGGAKLAVDLGAHLLSKLF
jgi:hypothetical protein